MRSPAGWASETCSVSTATIEWPATSERPQTILPCVSSATPVGLCIAPGEPGLPWIGVARVIGIGLGFGVFLTGDATDEPSIAAKQFVQAVEQTYLGCVRRPPSAYEGAAVHTCDHVTNHLRFHVAILIAVPPRWVGSIDHGLG